MEKLQTFLNKWGLLIIIILMMLIKFNTCNTQNHVEKLEKKITSLEQQINYNDSLDKIKRNYEMEIYNLKNERSVLHNMNEIVLKNIRPSQRISEIDDKIEQLNKELKI